MATLSRAALQADPPEVASLEALRRLLLGVDTPNADSSQRPEEFRLLLPDGEAVALPASVLALLRQSLGPLARGEELVLLMGERGLTTQEAAALLHISRPTLIALLDRGELPYVRPRRHRRLRLADVLAYKSRRDREVIAALDTLACEADELGLYELTAVEVTARDELDDVG